ncbi:ABC transporter ATP-binding protein [Glycomyces tritici]|uniref:ABC transporter ATP-binding protein n=1 Tax=Glycomyces tritici TaxID=2665176 RepID=A0ABT7YWX9_9ACTN|nr:ABC transporter ATP-binding protein [Glycomyces tritici]MDN3243142.1 ABC transporter ATP-binding protein [Glycomyces tritici]
MPVPAIEITNLAKRYGEAGPLAVNDVSLTVESGSVIGFLGPNGAGKTTTIKILAGLLSATSGSARLNGFHVVDQRANAMAQFGAVLEGSRNVYWTLSSWQNLIYFGRLKGLRKSAATARAERLLTELDLWERRHQKVGGFSRGMQQKVAIAAALIADPAIILLDEPTLGLDVAATRTVKNWIRTLARDEGKTILLTTHQLDVVEELCDRVAVVSSGRVVTDLPTGTLLSQFRQHDHYEIRVEARAEPVALPDGFTAVRGDEDTVVTGHVQGGDELYALIEALRGQGLPLRSLVQVQPSLEEVFLSLVEEPVHG